MKKIFLISLCLFEFTMYSQSDYSSLFKEANNQYSKGNYDEAIKSYEAILNKGFEASQLYFNLGNAYYRKDQIGLAILNYEKAKKLAPSDEDIETNLAIANLKTEDKIDALPTLFYAQWLNKTGQLMSEKNWSLTFIALITISLLLLAMYLISTNTSFKRLFFYAALVVFTTSFGFLFFAWHQCKQLKNHNKGIVVASTSTIKSSPDNNGTKLFILHEGTKVSITEQTGDWVEIKLANGNVGWLPKNDLKEI